MISRDDLPDTPDWRCEPRAIPDELWIDPDGPEGWKVRFPPNAPPNVTLGEN